MNQRSGATVSRTRLEFTPGSGTEIQSEWLMDRAYAAAVIEALRSIGPRIAPTIRSAEIRTVAADGLWLSSAYERDVFGVHFTWHPDAPRVDQCWPDRGWRTAGHFPDRNAPQLANCGAGTMGRWSFSQ